MDDALLPQPLTPLIGRERDLAALGGVLARPAARLVTILGPPGIGKTRLALAAAWHRRRTTADDVRFVPLASVRDPSFVLPTLARALGVHATPSDVSLIAAVAARLDGDPVLLVLDNVEQVVDAAQDVAELVTCCRGLRVLVTSRARLGVRGEVEWWTPPLELPRDGTVASLAACPAVTLLLDRGRAVREDLRLTEATAPDLAAISARLEGVPLAIELAAAWFRLFTPSQLRARLERRLPLPGAGARDLPARHQTLRAAVAWSDDLLTTGQRRLFRDLAVFVDGWTLDAAAAVHRPAGGVPAPGVVEEGLLALLDRSLVRRARGNGGDHRFRMLEMVREHALEGVTAGELASLRRRHAAHYLGLAEEAASHLYRADQARWMDRLEDELGNVRAALRWLIDAGSKEIALRMGTCLENFWLVHDHLRTGQRWLEEMLEMPGGADPLLEARARRALADLVVRQGHDARARALYEVNLVVACELGLADLSAETVLNLGALDLLRCELGAARARFERALTLARDAGDGRTAARALSRMGDVLRAGGDEAAALPYYEDSLSAWRRLGEKERIAMALHNLAPLVARAGDVGRAVDMLAESLGLSWELRNAHGAAICMIGIAGAVTERGGGTVRAARLLGAADAMRAAIGVQWEPVDRAEYERGVGLVRRRLDEATFAAAASEGAALTLADAVEQAGAALLACRAPARRAAPAELGGLTRREHEVALLVMEGSTNREVATALFISEKTVEAHVTHCLDKLALRSRAQLAAWAATRRAAREN